LCGVSQWGEVGRKLGQGERLSEAEHLFVGGRLLRRFGHNNEFFGAERHRHAAPLWTARNGICASFFICSPLLVLWGSGARARRTGPLARLICDHCRLVEPVDYCCLVEPVLPDFFALVPALAAGAGTPEIVVDLITSSFGKFASKYFLPLAVIWPWSGASP
jgi:hypothetical protein